MTRRLPASLLTLVLAVGWLVALAVPASAACHVAGFVESEVEVAESDGVATLVVELQGRQPSCAGTVDVATVDGTAIAGEDYEAVTQTLTFEEGDDRVETVEVPFLADDHADAGETFTVELANPTGSISNTGGPATVTITDAGSGAEASEAEPTESATAGDEPTGDAQDDPVGDAQESGEAEDADESEDGGGDLGIIIAVIAAIAIGAGAFVLLRGRG